MSFRYEQQVENGGDGDDEARDPDELHGLHPVELRAQLIEVCLGVFQVSRPCTGQPETALPS